MKPEHEKAPKPWRFYNDDDDDEIIVEFNFLRNQERLLLKQALPSDINLC